MKKLIILPLIAAAALGLAACKHDAPAPGNDTGNETSLNTEAPIDSSNIVDETTLNTSTVDNATAIDNASNATTK